MQIRIVLEPSDDGGYTVMVPSLPGCISEGNSRAEAIKNIKEAITIHLEPMENGLVYNPKAEILEIAV